MEFCTVTAVIADMPWTPWARNVLRSAWIPAPPPESDPATVRTRAGTGTTSTSVSNDRPRLPGRRLPPGAAGVAQLHRPLDRREQAGGPVEAQHRERQREPLAGDRLGAAELAQAVGPVDAAEAGLPHPAERQRRHPRERQHGVHAGHPRAQRAG